MHIILATDLSADALHAAEFAITAFGKEGHTYTLLTTYFDASLADPGGPMVTQALYEAANDGSAAFAKELEAHTGLKNMKREVIFSVQLASAANSLARETNADLVVVGNRGISGATIFGSNTVSMIKHSAIPVLTVPRSAPLRAPKCILFADDLKDVLPRGLGLLRRIALHLKASVVVGHVNDPQHSGPVTLRDSAPDLALAGVEHSIHHVEGEVVPALSTLAQQHGADMVATLHRHTDLLDRLFHPSISKQLAHHLELPLLVLQEPT